MGGWRRVLPRPCGFAHLDARSRPQPGWQLLVRLCTAERGEGCGSRQGRGEVSSTDTWQLLLEHPSAQGVKRVGLDEFASTANAVLPERMRRWENLFFGSGFLATRPYSSADMSCLRRERCLHPDSQICKIASEACGRPLQMLASAGTGHRPDPPRGQTYVSAV